MKFSNWLTFLFFTIVGVGCGFERIESGYVGVKVYQLGSDKGDIEVLGVGRHWEGWNEEIHKFPVYKQNYTWTQKPDDEGEAGDESMIFQTMEGMEVGADVGISYTLDGSKIETIFKTYRRGVDEITDTFLRNHVRDAMNTIGSKHTVESVYGNGKSEFMDAVQKAVRDQVGSQGINIEKIYLIGSFRLPEKVLAALNAKMEATQRAGQRENEVAEATAESNKKIAHARGEAESRLTVAKAEAEANKIIAQSLSAELVQYERIKRWNGVMPTTMLGGSENTLFSVK